MSDTVTLVDYGVLKERARIVGLLRKYSGIYRGEYGKFNAACAESLEIVADSIEGEQA